MMPLCPPYWRENVAVQKQLRGLLKEKLTLFVTNPKEVTIKEGRKYLTANGERIPLQRVNGVVYLSTAKVEPQKVLLKRVPTVVFTPSGEVYLSNVKTQRVDEETYGRLLREVCSFIGDDLQRFFQKYLTRKGAGFVTLRRNKKGKHYRVRESWYFYPTFITCTGEYPLWFVEEKMHYFIHTAKPHYAGEALVGFAIAAASNLNIPLPVFTEQPNKSYLTMYSKFKGGNTFSGVINPFYLFGAGVYALGFIDQIRAKTFNHTLLEDIPPKGQTFVFINEFIEKLRAKTPYL